MIKKKKVSKDNVVKFPSKLSDVDKQIEAIIFAAAEPLDVDTIESKISKKSNISKSLEKLQLEYSNRGINSLIFFNSLIKSILLLICFIPSSVVKTGNFGIFII